MSDSKEIPIREGWVYAARCNIIGYDDKEYDTVGMVRPFGEGDDRHWQYMHMHPEVPYEIQKLHQISDQEVVRVLDVFMHVDYLDYLAKM